MPHSKARQERHTPIPYTPNLPLPRMSTPAQRLTLLRRIRKGRHRLTTDEFVV